MEGGGGRRRRGGGSIYLWGGAPPSCYWGRSKVGMPLDRLTDIDVNVIGL